MHYYVMHIADGHRRQLLHQIQRICQLFVVLLPGTVTQVLVILTVITAPD